MTVPVLSFIVSLLVQVSLCNKLELVSVVHRHGDRSPIRSFPNSDYPISYWPQGGGQLTKVGMQQAYHLGEVLRQRYITNNTFINSNYTREQVYVRSTDVDRTLMTAQCVLASMFPPDKEQQFNESILWQPIPVHTVGYDNETLLRGYDVYCPTYTTLREETKNSQEYKQLDSNNQNFFNKLEEYTGLSEVNLSNVWSLEDALFIEYTNNLTASYSWFNLDLLKSLSSLSNYVLSSFYNSDEKATIAGGLWAAKVINDMKFKAEQKNNDPTKLFLYSAHDTTVAAMLSVFSMYNNIQPPYASAFIIELYSSDSDYFIKFYYRNETSSDTIVELFHPDCLTPCTLNNLIRVMDKYTVTEDEWKTICGITISQSLGAETSTPTLVGLSVTVAFLSIVSIIMIIAVVLLIILRYKKSYVDHDKYYRIK